MTPADLQHHPAGSVPALVVPGWLITVADLASLCGWTRIERWAERRMRRLAGH